MKLRAWINGYTFPVIQGATFKDNFNEELDSGTIIIEKYVDIPEEYQNIDFPAANDTQVDSNYDYEFNNYKDITKSIRDSLNLRQNMDVIIYDVEATKHREGWHRGKNNSDDTSNRYVPTYFYKHLLVKDATENEVFLGDHGDLNNNHNPGYKQYEKTYKYTIFLCSEIRKAEKKPLPNLKITQPLYLFQNNDANNSDRLILNKNSVWFYLNQYVDSYNATERINNVGIRKKYVLDKSVKDIFDDVICPEMALTGRTLREVLSALMIVKDRIPYIKDDVIYCINISEPTAVFDGTLGQVNYRNAQITDDDYVFGLRRNHSQSIAQDYSARSVEYLGFRDSSSPYLKLENLKVETRFPIYKINRIYMCYYKPTTISDKFYFCKQDITQLVKLSQERMALSKDWEQFENNYPQTIEELAQYKLATVEYTQGSKFITGWGEKYTFPRGWWYGDGSATYLENIICFLDNKYPKGVVDNFAVNQEDNTDSQYINVKPAISKTTNGLSDAFTSLGNVFIQDIAAFLKSVYFIVDYIPFYQGSTITSKSYGDIDDNLMSFDSVEPLVVLEKDGVNSKEKLERFGNKSYTYCYRYISSFDGNITAYSQLQPVGSIDRGINDGVVFHSREYAIYDNLINATYTGCEEYILKDYYTSVAAKYRTWSLMSFEESVQRNENITRYILVSRNERDDMGYENDTSLTLTSFENNSINYLVSKMFSFYNSSEEPSSTTGYKEKIIWNAGYFKCDYFYYNYNYLSRETDKISHTDGVFVTDLNSFVTGTALCFNITMDDNITNGTFIQKVTIDNDREWWDPVDDLVGSRQGQYFLTDANSNGKIENIKFGFMHCDYDDLVYSNSGTVDGDTMEDNMGILYKLPLLTSDDIAKTNILEFNEIVNKDNGEYLNFTMQFDFLTERNIIMTPLASKLNDLVTSFYKQRYITEGNHYKTISYTSSYDNSTAYPYPFDIFCTSLLAKTDTKMGSITGTDKFGLQYNNDASSSYNQFTADTEFDMYFPYITLVIKPQFSQYGYEFDLSNKNAKITYVNKESEFPSTSYSNPYVNNSHYQHIERMEITFKRIYASEQTESFNFSSRNHEVPYVKAIVDLDIYWKNGNLQNLTQLFIEDFELKLYKIRSGGTADSSSDFQGSYERPSGLPIFLNGEELNELIKDFDAVTDKNIVGNYDFTGCSFYRVMITEILNDAWDENGGGSYVRRAEFYPQSMNLVVSKSCYYDTMRTLTFVPGNENSISASLSLTTNSNLRSVVQGWTGAGKVTPMPDISILRGSGFNLIYNNTSNENVSGLVAPILETGNSQCFNIGTGNPKARFHCLYFNSSREGMTLPISDTTTNFPKLNKPEEHEDDGSKTSIYLNGIWRMQCGTGIISTDNRLNHAIDYWGDGNAVQVPFALMNEDADSTTNSISKNLLQNMYLVKLNSNYSFKKEDSYKEYSQEEFLLFINAHNGDTTKELGDHLEMADDFNITLNGNELSFDQSGTLAIFYRVDSNCGKYDNVGRISRGNYMLVFAVNNYTANSPIYISYLTKRDTRILDENHKVISHLGETE